MTIPLDRLYHYIESVAQDVTDVIIYQFYPHGSKNLENLQSLQYYDWVGHQIQPHIICHDQEPLNFNFYHNHHNHPVHDKDPLILLTKKYNCYQTRNIGFPGIFDQEILLHSEKQSPEVVKYQSIGFIPVYYWSHAIISQDWFRFAQHMKQRKNVKKTFLIYNRAWSGTREYRLKFIDFLIDNNIQNFCLTSLNSIEPELHKHYNEHVFEKSIWKPVNQLENFLKPNTAPSWSSADFDIEDYQSTDIEVVLETLFDDPRIHLTEKILRPIACGQPFILAATAGSLNYLREYGFKTYESVWNEDYDSIEDPYTRLLKIAELMKEIINWSNSLKEKKLQEARAIARYNKQHFFSKKFHTVIKTELAQNLKKALTELISTNTSSKFIEHRKTIAKFPEIKKIITGQVPNPYLKLFPDDHPWQQTCMKKSATLKVLSLARKYYNTKKNKFTQ